LTTEKSTPLGPNVKKLIAHKMAFDAVPAGSGIDSALKFLTSKNSISAGWVLASRWVKAALDAVRQAAEPNPWKNSSDEEIAAELLQRMEKRKHA
jgi:hypothetical protein